VFTPFVDPSNIDTEYTRFLTASVASQPVGATPVAAAPAAAPFLGAQPVAAAPAAEPFATKGEILAILAGKLGVATEEGAGPTIKGLTQLDFVEANYSAIKQKLVAQFGA
jgi:hypothetical protein